MRVARINLEHSSFRHANPLVVGQTLDGRTIRLLIGSFTSSPNLPSVIKLSKGPRPRVISTLGVYRTPRRIRLERAGFCHAGPRAGNKRFFLRRTRCNALKS